VLNLSALRSRTPPSDGIGDEVSTESGSDRVIRLAIWIIASTETRSLPLPVLTPSWSLIRSAIPKNN
jgi:hypothetical protein